MHPSRAIALATVTCAVLPAVAFARCEGYVPQPKPQNTFPQDVGRSLDRVLEEGWIEFAVYEDFPPWSYEVNGKTRGIDVDIGRMIAAALGVQARFRRVQAGETLDADLLNYVWKGAAIGGHVSDVMLHVPYDRNYACRIEQVSFTGQYATETIAIAYDKKTYPEKGPTPTFFRYDAVAVENDSISDFYLTSLLGPVDKIRRYRSTALAMQGLASGETMAAMGARAQLQASIKAHPSAGLAVHEPALVGFERSKWVLGVGVNFQHKDLAYAVDDAIDAALADGRIAAIFKSQGVTFEPPAR